MIKKINISSYGMTSRLTTLRFALFFMVMMMMCAGNATLYAQEDTSSVPAVTDTTQAVSGEEEVAEEPEETTYKSRMSLSADQYPDGTILLNGLLRARIDGSYQKVPKSKITFFVINAEGEEVAIGDSLTGADGVAAIRVNKSNLILNSEGAYSLLARFDGDNKFEGSETDLGLRPAALVMETSEEDSTYLLKFQATSESPDGPQPIAEAMVVVYVQRMFSSLKVAEGETDESGVVELEFPSGLPGDAEGNLMITAMIEETDEYGNIVSAVKQPWGYLVSAEDMESPKALWSPHPPTWMVITFFILMVAVWIHYVIVIYNLFRIKADAHHTSGKA